MIKLVSSQSFNQQRISKVFLERSIFSSFHVFTCNTYDDYGLNNIEYDILNQYFLFFTADLNKHYDPENNLKDLGTSTLPFKLIYIRSDPEVCFERLKTRHRNSENSIDLTYLRNIHLKYESWVSKLNGDCVITIDGNKNKVEVLKQIDDLVSK